MNHERPKEIYSGENQEDFNCVVNAYYQLVIHYGAMIARDYDLPVKTLDGKQLVLGYLNDRVCVINPDGSYREVLEHDDSQVSFPLLVSQKYWKIADDEEAKKRFREMHEETIGRVQSKVNSFEF